MSRRKDRKTEAVPVAEFRYRHEAEFAAGFLRDAGIPFRLQIDDGGGADLGLLVLRPAVLWVRAMDVDAAREVLGVEEGSDEGLAVRAAGEGSVVDAEAPPPDHEWGGVWGWIRSMLHALSGGAP